MLTDMLAKSSRSSRTVFSVVIVVILTVVAYNWILAPHTKYLHAAQQYSAVAGDVAVKNKIIKSKTAAKTKELRKLQSRFGRLRGWLFDPVEAKKFFSSIEVIGNETNCIIHSINFLSNKPAVVSDPAGGDAGIVKNSAVVSFAGSYGNIINFLAQIADRPKKVVVRSLAMTAANYESGPLECEATFTIYTIEDREILPNE